MRDLGRVIQQSIGGTEPLNSLDHICHCADRRDVTFTDRSQFVASLLDGLFPLGERLLIHRRHAETGRNLGGNLIPSIVPLDVLPLPGRRQRRPMFTEPGDHLREVIRDRDGFFVEFFHSPGQFAPANFVGTGLISG